MKILSIGNFGTAWDGSICDEEHIAHALEDLGHKVIRCQRDGFPEYFGEVYDFVLIAQWDGYTKDMIQVCKSFEGPLVYWAFDYQADGQEWHERLVHEADLYLSKRLADFKYPNWQWLSQDFAPQFLDRYPERVEKDIDVLFTGSYLNWAKERNETIRAVADNFNLVIHSVNAWPEEWHLDVRPPVMDKGLPELYARAKVILSIDHTIEAGYWSDRLSQIICCGGFALHRYQPLCESIFRSNVGYFFSKDDAVESVRWWLDHEEDRELIAAEAYDNAPYYKVKERVADMLNVVRNIL